MVEARRRPPPARPAALDQLHRGAPSTLDQLLGADSVHQTLVTTRYQEQVVGADRAAVDRVERLRISSIGRRDYIGAVRPTG